MEIDTRDAALLDWVNSFSPRTQAQYLEQLNDGIEIWEMLRDIDPGYFRGNLPEGPSGTGRWVFKWQNLKRISKSLVLYLEQECGQPLPDRAGLREMLMAKSKAAGVVKLLKLTLIAAINSPRAKVYIGRMQTFSTSTQAHLKNLIEESLAQDTAPRHTRSDKENQNSDSESDVEGTHYDGGSLPSNAVDVDLLFEERFGKLMAEKDVLVTEKKELQEDLRSLHNRLTRLQENNDTLQERLTKAEDRLNTRGSTDAITKETSIKQLESKIRQQESVIADQEAKLSENQANLDELKRIIDKLHISSAQVQKLKDELDEIKVERQNLARKANAAERYKQKLQASQGLENVNTDLRKELDEIRQQLNEADEGRNQVAGLELAVEEYKRILPKIEQDRHELQMMKKQLEFDNETLAQRWNAANEQHAQDQESIANLTDKLEELQRRLSLQPTAKNNHGLDLELENSTGEEDRLQNKVSELENEIQQLKSSAGNRDSKNAILQQFLDDANAKLEEREKKHLQLYKENLSLIASLESVSQGDPIQSTDVFHKMRDQVKAEQTRHADLEVELSSIKSQLQNSENKLSLVGVNESSAIEALKTHQSAVLAETQSENRRLTRQFQDIEHDLEEHKVILRDTMKEKKALEESKSSNEDIKAALQEFTREAANRAENPNSTSNSAFEKQITIMADKITAGRERLAKRAEHIKKQNALIKDLEHRLQQQSQGDKMPAEDRVAGNENASTDLDNPSQQLLIENLRRENKLMASAYHELAGRLQMNNVVLQRRGEAPRSWLNKQRKLVDHPMLAMGR